MSDPQDGFDLLEYPCDFQFKAMVRVSGLQPNQTAQQSMQSLVESQAKAITIKSVKSAPSRTGRFESVSLTIAIPDRETLEQIYSLLADDPNVVMTL